MSDNRRRVKKNKKDTRNRRSSSRQSDRSEDFSGNEASEDDNVSRRNR